jgi:hypothetical protein
MEVATIPTASPSSHMAIPYFASIATPAATPAHRMARLNAEHAPSEEIDAERLRDRSKVESGEDPREACESRRQTRAGRRDQLRHRVGAKQPSERSLDRRQSRYGDDRCEPQQPDIVAQKAGSPRRARHQRRLINVTEIRTSAADDELELIAEDVVSFGNSKVQRCGRGCDSPHPKARHDRTFSRFGDATPRMSSDIREIHQDRSPAAHARASLELIRPLSTKSSIVPLTACMQ